MEHKMFSTLSPLRLFFCCALPSMAGMAISSLYMVADGIFVGKFIGSNALAAINLVMPVIMISFALSDMIAVGSSVQISIRLDREKNGRPAPYSVSAAVKATGPPESERLPWPPGRSCSAGSK